MTPADAFAACELTVRRVDPDRYFSTLFAPADKRPFLFALYAFNHEIARAGQSGSEPPIGKIRLQWWREAVDEARVGQTRAHAVAVALTEVLSRTALDSKGLEALIDARETEVSILPFATLEAMESHAQATSSALMRIAAGLLGSGGDSFELTHEAGIAYGLTGMLRSIAFHAERGKLFLPENLLFEECATHADALAGKCGAALRRVLDKVSASAMQHFLRGKAMAVPHAIFPAVLPTALVPVYHARLMRSDPLRARSDLSQIRRQFILLRAVLRRRL
jgi:phytoene synthase